MLPTYCPSCRSIRQPNGSFCHMCGYSYVTKEAATPIATADGVVASSPRLTSGDGFRFGLGFMAAVFIASFVGFVAWLFAFGTILGAIFGLGR